MALTALCAVGLALSGYLSWHALQGGSLVGCGGGSPCDEVMNSRWSTIAGVLPVSGLAASAYLAMLVCSFSIGPATPTQVRRLAWSVLLVLAASAAGAAVWFTIVQKWIVGAFCPYCMATHVTGVLLAALVVWRAPQAIAEAERTGSPANGSVRRVVVRPVLAGVALTAIFVAMQMGLAPASTYRRGESRAKLTAVDPRAVPLIGPADARYVVTLLFDYKCPHCQQLHLMLHEAIRRSGGKLAFALSPAPLNRQCNPYVPRDVDEFKDSCELTRIALGVWLADRTAFPAFDNWMYSFDSGDRWRPRTLEAARAKAIELVGRTKFDAAANDPWIEHYIQTSVHLYGETMQNGKGGVPKLVYGARWVTPQPATVADLIYILQSSLGVPKG